MTFGLKKMKSYRYSSAVITGLVAIVLAAPLRSATILEGRFIGDGPVALGNPFSGGYVYVRSQGDVVDYSVWLGPSAGSNIRMTFSGFDGFLESHDLSFDGSISFHGCDPFPRNPFVGSPLLDVGNSNTCDAISTWHHWSGTLETSALVREFESSSIPFASIENYRADLHPVPESSVSSLFPGAMLVALARRKRPNKA